MVLDGTGIASVAFAATTIPAGVRVLQALLLRAALS
jgi:hypothetical protein